MRHFITYIFILAFSLLAAAAPIPGIIPSIHSPEERALPATAPSLPNPNSWIFDRALLGAIQGQAKKPNKEFFEDVHGQLMNAWKAQVEVKRYWEVVAENKSTQAAQAVEVGANLAARESGEWAKEDKFQWRTNCEWLIGVSRRLTSVYKLPVPALSIFPDATPRYCMLKL